jgi:hypothetical protein
MKTRSLGFPTRESPIIAVKKNAYLIISLSRKRSAGTLSRWIKVKKAWYITIAQCFSEVSLERLQ